MFVESHPRPHSPVLSPQRSDLQTFRRADDPYQAKPFPVNLFADPHPLNLYATILYKKGGGRGLSHLPTLTRSNVQTSPIPTSPLDATLTKNPGGGVILQATHPSSQMFYSLVAASFFSPFALWTKHSSTFRRSDLRTCRRVTDHRPCFKRTVAFPQHRTSRPLCGAPPSGTIEVHAEAKSASRTRPLADGRRIATSWVR